MQSYIIYKTINNITEKFYIGKAFKNDPKYLGSGKLLIKAIKKHGRNKFTKVILESNLTKKQADIREKHWIKKTGALGSMGYNMAEGGTGGDRSKFIPYHKFDWSKTSQVGLRRFWANLTPAQKKAQFKKQAQKRAKTYYLSRIDTPEKEIKVVNLQQWSVSKGTESRNFHALMKPGHRLYGKQHRGWRIRRPDMPKWPSYENRRGQNQSDFCKGKTWQLRNGKREWITV
jgi:hypothetical protein